MPKSASKSASKKPNAAPPPVTRDQAKVQLLTTMVALKDEILRASDEKVRALKWAALNDFDKDATSLEALLSQLWCPKKAEWDRALRLDDVDALYNTWSTTSES